MAEDQRIESPADFPNTPEGWHRRWTVELEAATKEVEQFHTDGKACIELYKNEKTEDGSKRDKRWALYASNLDVFFAIMYGHPPEVDVSRRFKDAEDSVGRVLGEMMERMLNCDIDQAGDSYAATLDHSLFDWLCPGMGVARIRYDANLVPKKGKPAKVDEEGNELAPAVPDTEQRSSENVHVDWIPWDKFRWSAGSQVWGDVRWVAFEALMTKPSVTKRFGAKTAALISFVTPRSKGEGTDNKAERNMPWARAEVWEIWDKETKSVFWYSKGAGVILDRKKDTLQLEGFWPCPEPMRARTTTDTFVPKSLYSLARDQYEEVNELTRKISLCEEALAVKGIYDSSASAVKKLLDNTDMNELVGSEGWLAFKDKGGLKGAIEWLPIDMIVAVLEKLREARTEAIAGINQITGMSDIIRGESADVAVTATEQRIKGRYASVRVQAMQDEFARFASDLQCLKAEVIARFFAPATIIQRSNIALTPDADRAMDAIALLKSKWGLYRVEVRPDSLAQTDFDRLQNERSQLLQSIAAFLQQAGPLAQMFPASVPMLLELLKWNISALPGSAEIQGVIDRAITQAQQAASQPQPQQPPDPKLLANAQKAQMDAQREDQKFRHDVMRMQLETQESAKRQADQTQQNLLEQAGREAIRRTSAPPMLPGGNGI